MSSSQVSLTRSMRTCLPGSGEFVQASSGVERLHIRQGALHGGQTVALLSNQVPGGETEGILSHMPVNNEQRNRLHSPVDLASEDALLLLNLLGTTEGDDLRPRSGRFPQCTGGCHGAEGEIRS